MSDIKIEDFVLKINLNTLIEKLDEEESRQLIKTLAIQPKIIKSVVDYICGDDADGFWSSEEPQLRQGILERIERTHINTLATSGPRYGWSVWQDIQKQLKDIKCKQHVYWALYHDEYFKEKYDWTLISNFFKRHNIESDYTTKKADEDILQVKQMIIDAFRKMEAKGE